EKGGEGVVGPEAEDQAGGGGDAFAAFEAEIDGEHVAEDGGEADEEPGEEELGVELVGSEMGAAEDHVGGEHGEKGFEEVEGEDEGEVFSSEESGDVGGADVSGAGFAGVDAF